MRFINLIFLGYFHCGQNLIVFRVKKSDFLTNREGIGQGLGCREGNGDRPKKTVCHLVGIANSFPVIIAHETFQRGKGTDGQHKHIAGFPGGHGNYGERLCLCLFFF